MTLALKLHRNEFKTILKLLLIFISIFGFPICALLFGTYINAAYNLMNLMAVFPALKFVDFVLLAVPFAFVRQITVVQEICALQTFRGKRKLLNALRRFR